MRVLLDTNILVRAFLASEGPANSVLLSLLRPDFQLVLSEAILFEVARILRLTRIVAIHRDSEEAVYNFIGRLRNLAEIVPPSPLIQTPIRDAKDIAIMQAALSGNVDVLCTYDRDFFTPPASTFLRSRKIEAMTDAELIRRLRR